MADYSLADMLQGRQPQAEEARPYGRPGFPNLDPRAYFQQPPESGTGLQNFAQQAPWALMGMGARPAPSGSAAQALNMQKLPRRPDSEAVAQGMYEAVLGRPPGGGPGSGHMNPNGRLPIPKSPLAWLASGGVGYGVWNALGGPEALQGLRDIYTPGTAEHEREQQRLSAFMDGVNKSGDPIRLATHYGHSFWPDTTGSRGVPVLKDQPY